MLDWLRQNSGLGGADRRRREESLRLRRLFDDTHNLAWRTLRRFGVPADRLEDSFQQVFLVVSERLADIEPGKERSFVYGVTLRVARTCGRDRSRETLGDEPDEHAGGELGADVLFDRGQLVEMCDRILHLLPPPLKEVFILRELEGLSGSEIAALLEIPHGTVQSRLRRARLRMRQEVEALSKTVELAEFRRG